VIFICGAAESRSKLFRILDSILDYNDFLWSYSYCYFVQVIDMWYLEFFSESSPSQVSTLHKKCGAQLWQHSLAPELYNLPPLRLADSLNAASSHRIQMGRKRKPGKTRGESNSLKTAMTVIPAGCIESTSPHDTNSNDQVSRFPWELRLLSILVLIIALIEYIRESLIRAPLWNSYRVVPVAGEEYEHCGLNFSSSWVPIRNWPRQPIAFSGYSLTQFSGREGCSFSIDAPLVAAHVSLWLMCLDYTLSRTKFGALFIVSGLITFFAFPLLPLDVFKLPNSLVCNSATQRNTDISGIGVSIYVRSTF